MLLWVVFVVFVVVLPAMCNTATKTTQSNMTTKTNLFGFGPHVAMLPAM